MVLRHHLHQVEGQIDLQQLGVLLIRRQSHRHLRFHPAKIKGECWVEMHQIIKEPPCPLFEAVRHSSQTMDHTSKVQERRDEDQDKHHLHQFKDRRDLHLCVQECHLHLHHQSQMFLEVGVEIIIRLPHHRHQCNLKSQVSSVIVILHHFRQPEKIHYLKVKEVMNLRENNTLVHLRLGFPACSRRLNFYHLQNPSLHRQKLIRAGAQDRW